MGKAQSREPKPIEIPEYSTGQVAEVLEIPIWRLQKFLDVKSYPLSPTGKLGSGKGSRRMFSLQDVYRIAVTVWLIEDGFSPKWVVQALQFVDDRDLLDVDRDGNIVRGGIAFRRTAKGDRQIDFFDGGNAPKGRDRYYALDFSDVINRVDARIRELGLKTI